MKSGKKKRRKKALPVLSLLYIISIIGHSMVQGCLIITWKARKSRRRKQER